MLSQAEFNPMTQSKEAMPESSKFDGPKGLTISNVQDKFAANSHTSLPKPGFSS
jgi:hypothetical protein